MVSTIIIKYRGGNVRSLQNALMRLGENSVCTDNPSLINKSSRIIIPGVGRADTAMGDLRKKGLDKLIKGLKQPVLGICLGMQILCRYSEEGNTNCIGVFDTDVKKFRTHDLIIPHVGWNRAEADDNSSINKEIESYFYFVHSYFAGRCCHTSAKTFYGEEFSSILKKDNFWGVQFHPEKSGRAGSEFLREFLNFRSNLNER